MNFFIIFLFIPLLAYITLLLYLTFRKRHISFNELAYDVSPKSVGILIPMRNEEEHIAALLEDLLQQEYPKHLVKIYVIDDHSTDDSVSIVNSIQDPRLCVMELPAHVSTKKKAIQYALKEVESERIICTDADCRVGKLWISTHMRALSNAENKVVINTGNVFIRPDKTLFSRIQHFELIAMMRVTKLGIHSGLFFMANGANMSYSKKGYALAEPEMNYARASGDDTYLIQALEKRLPGCAAFIGLKENIVWTKAISTFSTFLQQRLRWASKSITMENRMIYYFQSLLWLSMAIFFISIFLIPWIGVLWTLIYFVCILVIDLSLLFPYRKWIAWEWTDILVLPLTVLFHAFYIIGIGVWSQFNTSYDWKGRKLK